MMMTIKLFLSGLLTTKIMSLIVWKKLTKITIIFLIPCLQGPLGGGGRSGALSVTLRAALKVVTIFFVFVLYLSLYLTVFLSYLEPSFSLLSGPSIGVNKTKSIPEPNTNIDL